jgi:hypothetical protein
MASAQLMRGALRLAPARICALARQVSLVMASFARPLTLAQTSMVDVTLSLSAQALDRASVSAVALLASMVTAASASRQTSATT